jgi:putative N6-adenine-specific DNA methylase
MPCPSNLEKQIKRHVIAPRHLCYAVTAPGMEQLCAQELAGLSDQIQVEATVRGGVVFSGRLEALYQANLHLRTAGRLLLRVAEFKATNFRQLGKRCATVPWERYLPWGALPVCKVTSHQSRLYHSQAVAQHVALALTDCWRNLGAAPADAPDQSLFVRLDQDLVTLSLDSSGANLYRRGLKTHGGQAPLRETLAAAILRMAGYNPERPLLDPMCGAGSFALEAALWAKQIPPGFHREFAFMQWPAFRPRQWQHLRTTAQKAIRSLPHPLIHASDLDPEACRRLAACVAHHHLDDAVDVQCHDFFALQPPPARDGHPPATGLIVLNPPYGVRLTPDQRMETFYKRIGAKLADDFKGWQVALIVPSPHLIGTQPFPTTSIPLLHGGLQLTLLVGRVKH